MKRVFFLLTVLMLTVTGANSAFAADSDTSDINEETHTLILRRIDEPTEFYDYYWEVETEPGQIEEGMNIMGRGTVPLDRFDEQDTLFAFADRDMNMDFLDGRFGLTKELLLSDDFESIEITYTFDDVLAYAEYMNLEPRFSVANNKTENSKSVTRTTGEIDTTLYVGGDNYTTDPETKDDDENRAYVTITKILPNAYPDFLGIAVRVCEYPNGPAMTAWWDIDYPQRTTLSYRTFEPEVDGEYYLEIANSNDRNTDVEGRWTP